MGTKLTHSPGKAPVGASSPRIPQRWNPCCHSPTRMAGCSLCLLTGSSQPPVLNVPSRYCGKCFFSAPKPLLSAPSLPWLWVCSLLQRLQTVSWSDVTICNSTAHLNILNHPEMPHIWTENTRQKHKFYRFNPNTFKGCMWIKALVWSMILPSWLSSQNPGSKFCFLSWRKFSQLQSLKIEIM